MSKAAGLVVGVVLVLTGCVSAQPAPDSLEEYYQQTLDWRSCGSNECASLLVPVDYDDLSRGSISLAVLRHRGGNGNATKNLVVNPGGPGGSGVDYARAANNIVSPEVNEVYNVVGFDPRGVGDSAGIDCISDSELDTWLAIDPAPDNAEQQQELQALADDFAAGCGTSEIVDSLTTANVVRDLDVLRSALGEDQLDYLGKSYGTLIGSRYAQSFPDQVGRFVLDGVLPPGLSSAEVALAQAIGFDETLARFVEDCQRTSTECPLNGDVADGVAQIQDFLTDLKKKPIPAGDRELTQGLALGAILYNLYFPTSGDWTKLEDALALAFGGNGKELLRLYDQRLGRGPTGKYADNSLEAFYAVTCLDRESEDDPAVLAKRAKEWDKEAPTFGEFLAWTDLVCANWPAPAVAQPEFQDVKTATPVLLVSTTYDPATPAHWAELLHEELIDSKLVLWDADGHTAYNHGSNCVDDVVDAYLVNGDIPPNDVDCPTV